MLGEEKVGARGNRRIHRRLSYCTVLHCATVVISRAGCWLPHCCRSMIAAYQLLRQGFTDIGILRGGFGEWRGSGRCERGSGVQGVGKECLWQG